MLRVLYIACSSFSGSTLLSLLLNTHPEMATVGHSSGWPSANAEFPCSCGAKLDECPFWRYVGKSFRDNGLPFAYNDFGTRYELVGSKRLNRYLTAKLPFISSGALERIRDELVRRFPGWSANLARTDKAYRTLIESTLSYHGATVYIDNSHAPHALRHLRRIADLEVSAIHLVRDIRGNVYSRKKNSGWSTADAARRWLADQSEIVRILEEMDTTMTVFYEDLCERPNETLNGICDLIGVSPHHFNANFGIAEHHVLGNDMRLGSTRIKNTAAWRNALTPSDLKEVEGVTRAFAVRHGESLVFKFSQRYLG